MFADRAKKHKNIVTKIIELKAMLRIRVTLSDADTLSPLSGELDWIVVDVGSQPPR